MGQGTLFTEIVATWCNYWADEDLLAYPTDHWQSIFINITYWIFWMNLIVFFIWSPWNINSHYSQLLSFLFLFILLIELPARLIVAPVVDKNTGITKTTVTSFKEILTQLRVIIDSSGVSHKSWSFLWSKCTWKLLLPQIRFCLIKIISISI